MLKAPSCGLCGRQRAFQGRALTYYFCSHCDGVCPLPDHQCSTCGPIVTLMLNPPIVLNPPEAQ